MSKERHTPTSISQYIDKRITDIRIKVYSGAPCDETEHRLHGLNLDIAAKLDNMQSNHDRLVEALEKVIEVLGKYPIPSMKSEEVKAYQEAQQLLTELKQQ